MKKTLFLLAIILFISFPSFSQSYQADSVQIAKIIQDVFDGMRESDTSKMAPYMHPNIKMQSLSVDEKGNEVLLKVG